MAVERLRLKKMNATHSSIRAVSTARVWGPRASELGQVWVALVCGCAESDFYVHSRVMHVLLGPCILHRPSPLLRTPPPFFLTEPAGKPGPAVQPSTLSMHQALPDLELFLSLNSYTAASGLG
jgi:hypothetical protein